MIEKPPPEGYTEKWNPEIWNVGFVFQWSEVYDDWLDLRFRITVKPNQSLSEAYRIAADEPLWKEYKIFFLKDF